MAKDIPINVSTPPNIGEPVKFGASRIRELKQGLIELMNVDHYVGNTTDSAYTEDAAGRHKQLTVVNASGETIGTVSVLEDEDGNKELFFTDEAENIVQLTVGGRLGSSGDGVSSNPRIRLLNTQATNAAGDSYCDVVLEGKNGIMGKITCSHYGTSNDSKGKMTLDVSDGATVKSFELNETEIKCDSRPITGVADPTNAQDAATKAYVDGVSEILLNEKSSQPSVDTWETLLTKNVSLTAGRRTLVIVNINVRFNEGDTYEVALTETHDSVETVLASSQHMGGDHGDVHQISFAVWIEEPTEDTYVFAVKAEYDRTDSRYTRRWNISVAQF